MKTLTVKRMIEIPMPLYERAKKFALMHGDMADMIRAGLEKEVEERERKLNANQNQAQNTETAKAS